MPVQRLRRVLARIVAAARRYEASPLAVLRRMVALRASRGVRLEEAYLAGLLDPRLPLERIAGFVGRREFLQALQPFNAGLRELVDDKAVFAARASSEGLAIPRTLALVTPPLAFDAQGRPLQAEDDWTRWFRDTLPSAFVVKPARGMGGQRIDFFEKRGGEVWLGSRRLTPDQLRGRLCEEAPYGPAIVQERIRNHSSLVKLSGTDALQCTRMVTVIARSGAIELLVAFQKLIVGPHQFDNVAGSWTRNIVAAIEPGSGTLGAAWSDGAPCAFHPQTAMAIREFSLPHWTRARALVERAALLARPLRAIGWDVALTEDGPLLIEGNSEWLAFGETGLYYSSADLARLQRLF